MDVHSIRKPNPTNMSKATSIALFSNPRDERFTDPAQEVEYKVRINGPVAAFESPCKQSVDDDDDSLRFIMSNTDSLDSFKKFNESVIQRIVDSANRPLTPSVKCPSDQSEVHKVFKGLPSPTEEQDTLDEQKQEKVQHINPLMKLIQSPDKETFTAFNKLFMHRYQQLAQGRLTVKPQDLRQYTDMLMHLQKEKKAQKAKKIINFDKIIDA